MTSTRIATIAAEPDREAALATALSCLEDVELVMRCVDRVEFLAALRGGDLDAIVSVGAAPWLDRDDSHELYSAGVRLIGMTDHPLDADRLTDLGASILPSEATLEEVLRCARRQDTDAPPPLPSSQPSRPTGRVTAVWGPKGAPGRTTVAIELAFQLQRGGSDVFLIDGDTYGGDVSQLLGFEEELPSIVWAARLAARDELDAARLTLDLRRAGNGPVVLPGLTRSDLWAEISDVGWQQLLTAASASFDHVVCDVGGCLERSTGSFGDPGEGRNRLARSTLRAADRVVAVLRADPIGVKNLIWSIPEVFELAERDDVLIVANRVRNGDEAEIGALLRRHVGKRPVAYIPDRAADLARAVATGRSVSEAVPRSGLAAPVASVAAALGGKLSSNGLLARMAGKQ